MAVRIFSKLPAGARSSGVLGVMERLRPPVEILSMSIDAEVEVLKGKSQENCYR